MEDWAEYVALRKVRKHRKGLSPLDLNFQDIQGLLKSFVDQPSQKDPEGVDSSGDNWGIADDFPGQVLELGGGIASGTHKDNWQMPGGANTQ